MKGKLGKTGLLCLAVLLALVGVGVGLAHWQETLTIEGTVETGTWDVGGTPGFWKNWDSHNTYTETEILDFLRPIDGLSDWLVPDMDENGIIDINDMEAVFAAGEGGTMEERFLRHYLATRLNERADRRYPDTVHGFGTYDPANYLALGGQGTLDEIIDAIEDKYPAPDEDSPTEGQFEIMKNICDGLNNLAI